MNGFSIYWVLWATVLWVPLEIYTLIRCPENSLLANVSRLIGRDNGRPWSAVHFFLACFLTWLFFHISFGWFR